MSTITEIESAVSQLSAKELTEFRNWFNEFDALAWDKKFEEDVKGGKLDTLASKAISDFKAGRFREL
ncbi:hypothetical protein IC229_23385 [Spirosoma sp. BT702]|uniref:Uncharacterized protein n=1 Tax=Spirosoma profusum TaxID=2771354 RepID=A0A926Y319_9BACT|nr:hypothetical protein [Spirosoma profusum]MBD2703607.1 hypothetical protein [Spirosoma profusum]